MSTGEIVLAVASGLLINEIGDWCPWLARRSAAWAAHRLYRDDPDRAAVRAEEWAGVIADRPGKLFTLFTAARFVLAAVTPGARSMAASCRAWMAKTGPDFGFEVAGLPAAAWITYVAATTGRTAAVVMVVLQAEQLTGLWAGRAPGPAARWWSKRRPGETPDTVSAGHRHYAHAVLLDACCLTIGVLVSAVIAIAAMIRVGAPAVVTAVIVLGILARMPRVTVRMRIAIGVRRRARAQTPAE